MKIQLEWSDEIDGVLGGDITAGLAYTTPAGGAVVTPVATVGLHDREAGTVAFTTSLGFGRKIERLRRNPRVALSYHAREYGFSPSPRAVLVQGTASIDLNPDPSLLDGTIRPAAERFLGPVKTGRLFWDRWLREYYQDRVVVTVKVSRILAWPTLGASGTPEVSGKAAAGPPKPQASPKNGTGPRVDAARAASRLRRLQHHLLAFVDGDGFPMVLPVTVTADTQRPAIALGCATPLPEGGRRAGLLGHSYRAQLIGLAVRQHTGWLQVGQDQTPSYAPHTAKSFLAPPNKTLLLLANGFLAKQGLSKARRAADVPGSERV